MTKSEYFIPKFNLSYKMNFPFLPPMIMSLNLNTEHIIYSSREEVNLTIFSRIHTKPINIRWNRTGSHPYEKVMSSIVLYPVFYECHVVISWLKKTGFNLIVVHFISAESCV